MTNEEAIVWLETAGLVAKLRQTHIFGAQKYEPPKAPIYIGMFTGTCFNIDLPNIIPNIIGQGGGPRANYLVSYQTGPQQTEEKTVNTLEEAVQIVLNNVKPL